jgi:methionyl-tRNA formyltransferase
MEMGENIIKQEAKKIFRISQKESSGIPFSSSDIICTPSKLNPSKSEEGQMFAQRLTDKAPDFLVVIAYGKIIPQAILDIAKIAPINVHGSLLPKYRGASPIQTCLLNGDQETGITIMKMDATMDTGAMIDKSKFPIQR